MHVCQSEVAAGVVVGKSLVIEAHEAEHGRVQVVHMYRLFDGFEAEFVGGTVGLAAFDAAAGQPASEAPVVVVAAVDLARICAGLRQLDGGRAAKFASPED